MAYVMYLRKSRADREAELHGEGETLARHEKALLDYAKRIHLEIQEIYKEIVSGDSIHSRPQMQRLLEEVAQGQWEGVFVMEIERLARGDTKDQGIVAEAFKAGNTKIMTPAKIYDPKNEFDEEYFEFGLFMSRREYKTINRRIQRGRIASLQEGKYIAGSAPYGYEKVKLSNEKGYTLEPISPQNETVQLIYELYTKGELLSDGAYRRLGMSLIAKKLDDMLLKPPKAEKWSRSTIKDILTNPIYIGKIRWQRRKTLKKMENGNTIQKQYVNENCMLADGIHKPLISEPMFLRAQQIMKERGHSPVISSHILKNPLSGLLFCGVCGRLMNRASSNTKCPYDIVLCPNPDCSNVSAPLSLVENAVLSFLLRHTSDYSIEYHKDTSRKFPCPKLEAMETSITEGERELASLTKQYGNIHDLLERGIYDYDTFHQRSLILNSSIQEVNKRLTELKSRRDSEYIPPIPHAIQKLPVNIFELYNFLPDISAKNELLKELLHHITYRKDKANKKGKREHPNFSLKVFPRF